MAIEQYANSPHPSTPTLGWSTLALAMDASTTSLTPVSAAAFSASAQFRLLVDDEWMLVTDRSSIPWVVTRGIEGSTAAPHAIGASLYQVVTAAALLASPGAMTTSGDLQYLDASLRPARLALAANGALYGVAANAPACSVALDGRMASLELPNNGHLYSRTTAAGQISLIYFDAANNLVARHEHNFGGAVYGTSHSGSTGTDGSVTIQHRGQSYLTISDTVLALPRLTSNGVLTTSGGVGTVGVTALGSALQVLRVNAGGTALEFAAPSGGSGLTVGTSTITSGTTTRVLYDNAGVLGEYTLTGSGTVVAMQTAPTFVTSITAPLLIGGTGTTSTLTLRSTSGVGATGADIIFQTGNNGATETGRILNNGKFIIGTAASIPSTRGIAHLWDPDSSTFQIWTNCSLLAMGNSATTHGYIGKGKSGANHCIILIPDASQASGQQMTQYFGPQNQFGTDDYFIQSTPKNSSTGYVIYEGYAAFGTVFSNYSFTGGGAILFAPQRAEAARLTPAGLFGVGTGATVSAKFHVITTTEQLRLGYDASNYLSTTISSVGSATLAVTGTNPSIVLTPAGTGIVSSPATFRAHSGTAIPAGGTAGAGVTFSSATNFGTFFGSGAPTLSAAKGSLYLRSDGSGTTDRAYINTDGGTTWTALTTVA